MVKIMTIISRVLAILLILFVVMFSLDVFGRDKTLLKQIVDFLIHNIVRYGRK